MSFSAASSGREPPYNVAILTVAGRGSSSAGALVGVRVGR